MIELERRVAFEASNEEDLKLALRSQAWRGDVIFWAAMFIIVLGLCAAALHFRLVWRDQSDTQTEITISDKKISIKTAWIGVVLLAMSMAFLALYLELVYRIEPLWAP